MGPLSGGSPQDRAFPDRETDLVRRARCPICTGVHRPDTVVDGLHYVRCVSCGLVFMDPMPSQSWYDSLYASDYWIGRARVDDAAGEVSRRLRKEHLRAVQYVHALEQAGGVPVGGAVLEIGCGSGGAVATIARRFGCSAVAVEPDRESRSLASRIGVMIEEGGIAQLLAGGRTFDVVLLSHVLEHVVDPAAFIRSVVELLAPEGRILVEVPNGFTNESLHLFHPYLFTRRALTVLLSQSGLQASVRAHGGASSRMRAHYLLALMTRSDRPVARGRRRGRRITRAWSRAWNRAGILRRIDGALARRSVVADDALLDHWESLLAAKP